MISRAQGISGLAISLMGLWVGLVITLLSQGIWSASQRRAC